MVTRCVPQGSAFINIFVNNLDDGMECAHSKTAGHTKLGGKGLMNWNMEQQHLSSQRNGLRSTL